MHSLNKIVILVLVLIAFAVIIFTFIQAVKLPDKPIEITSSYIESPYAKRDYCFSICRLPPVNILPQEFMSITEQEEVFEGQAEEQSSYSPNITEKIIELLNIKHGESIAHINSGYGFFNNSSIKGSRR